MTGVRYVDEIIEAFSHPYAGAVGQDFMLMAEIISTCRELAMSTLNAKSVEHMDLPAPSPGDNPLEQVWNILKQQISAQPAQPQTQEDLAQAFRPDIYLTWCVTFNK